MKILITGANGFLGQHLCRHLLQQHAVWATGKGPRRIPLDIAGYISADLCDTGAVRDLVREVQPEVIIHTAAMSKPDECDQNRGACHTVNVEATAAIVSAAKELSKAPHLIYTSTDFVLGERGPHDETAAPAPLNYYGESKLAAEVIVQESGLFYTIVRPVFMYGETWEGLRATFLDWVGESLAAGRSIRVVNDQQRTPTYVGDICAGIASIIDRKAAGLFHLAGSEIFTPWQMAVQYATALGLNTALIEPVTEDTFPEPVRRAKRGGLVADKARRELGFNPRRFAEGVSTMLTEKATVSNDK